MIIVNVSLDEFNDVVNAINSESSDDVGNWHDSGDGVFEKPTNSIDKYRVEIKKEEDKFILTVFED